MFLQDGQQAHFPVSTTTDITMATAQVQQVIGPQAVAAPTAETIPSPSAIALLNGAEKDAANTIHVRELGTGRFSPPTLATAASTKPSLLIIYGDGQESIVSLIADVLGQPWELARSVPDAFAGFGATIYGVARRAIGNALDQRTHGGRLIVNAHCLDTEPDLDEALAAKCDHEYLYTHSPFLRRDLARFLSFILGQTDHHRALAAKARTTLISTTFPDVHAALPNLDILSVGADAVELRVDLLREPLTDGSFREPVPSLRYVGEQLTILRQRTELPIIYTTRCIAENGRFPMEDPALFWTYLHRAIQWGVEYVDVELWLPEEIRRRLAREKGHSRIISAFHDFSGRFEWTSERAVALFEEGARHADVVKMIALVGSPQANYALEYFRSLVAQRHPAGPPFSGLNMGPAGQLSRALNRIFTPITHPLLPMIAAPGQLSAAEINQALHGMGHLPRRDIYGLGPARSAATTQALFFEKCFNELSLPHTFLFVERAAPPPPPPSSSLPLPRQGRSSSSSLSPSPPHNGTASATATIPIPTLLQRPGFGGAYMDPPVPAGATAAYLPRLSAAAKAIGLVDTIVVQEEEGDGEAEVAGAGSRRPSAALLVGENLAHAGIRATLVREVVPSAYRGRTALVLAGCEADAAPALYALRSLEIGAIYSVGFRCGAAGRGRGGGGAGGGAEIPPVHPIRDLDDVKGLEAPFVLVSALPPGKAGLVKPLLRFYGRRPSSRASGGVGRVFVEVTAAAAAASEDGGGGDGGAGGGGNGNGVLAVAAKEGWTAYSAADVAAWTTVARMRALVGQSVPWDFVRLAGGRVL